MRTESEDTWGPIFSSLKAIEGCNVEGRTKIMDQEKSIYHSFKIAISNSRISSDMLHFRNTMSRVLGSERLMGVFYYERALRAPLLSQCSM